MLGGKINTDLAVEIDKLEFNQGRCPGIYINTNGRSLILFSPSCELTEEYLAHFKHLD